MLVGELATALAEAIQRRHNLGDIAPAQVAAALELEIRSAELALMRTWTAENHNGRT